MLYVENNALGKPLSRIAFGGAGISGEGGGYGFGPVSEAEAEGLIRASWDAGINLFDTAPIYGFGLSEERLGRYLPKDAVVVSKCGVDWHSTKRVNMTNEPKVALRMLHESLRRLRREVIDIYLVHWPDPRVDIRRTLEVLSKAQEQGLINQLGLCNTTAEDLQHGTEICELNFLQSELNLFNTSPFERLAGQWQTRFSMGWGTFDKGILSGRVQAGRKYEKEDCRSWAPWWDRQLVQEKVERTQKLQLILKDYHLSLAEFCLQFNLFYFGISSALVGLKKVGDVVEVTSNLQQEYIHERIAEVLTRWKS
jgi:aryl-alcohol dehydrogenase-like predicted oxidoreductase